MVDDIVTGGALGKIIHRSYVQQHLEIKCWIVLQGSEDFFDIFAFHGNRQITAKLPHVHQVLRKTLLECSCNRPLYILILLEKSYQRARRTLKIMNRRIQFGSLEARLP